MTRIGFIYIIFFLVISDKSSYMDIITEDLNEDSDASYETPAFF